VKKMLGSRINYSVLKAAAEQLGMQGLPDELTDELLEDVDVLQTLHHSLLELHLEEGALICPETGRRFPVSQGILNMLLNADEV
jgi:multifunctional methyltransferase subunit TRM112